MQSPTSGKETGVPGAPLACGIDLGTSKCAAAIVRVDDGATVAESCVEHAADVSGLPAGWSEQDPAKILAAAAAAVRGLPPDLRRRVRAAGVTGQMHGVVLAGPEGPETNLITWQDARCGPSFLAELRRITGRADLHPGYGGATLAWLVREGRLPAGDVAACTIHDLLVRRLTGRSRPCTDPTDAASWGWYDIRRQRWAGQAWERAGVPLHVLPEIVPCGSCAGRLAAGPAQEFGLPPGIPVSAALGDNQASVLAALRGEQAEDALVLTLGTGGQLSAVLAAGATLPEIPPGGPVEVRPFPDDRLLVAAAALCGGSALAWLVDTIRKWCEALELPVPAAGDLYARLDAAGMRSDGGGLSWTPRFLGERGSPDERAVLAGMTFDNVTPGNVMLSLARGVVANLADMMPEDLVRSRRCVVGTGNAVRRLEVVRRAVREVLRIPLKLSAGGEEAAAGAAVLAGRLLSRES